MSSKAQKKLLDNELPASKKFKSIASYIEDSPVDEVKEFLKANYQQIYQVVLDAITQLNHSVTQKSKLISEKDVGYMCTILKSLFVHVSDIFAKKWQLRSLVSVFERFLDPEAAYPIRRLALEPLLYFMDILGDRCGDSLMNLLLRTLEFGAFSHYARAPGPGSLLFPEYTIRALDPGEKLVLPQARERPTTEEDLRDAFSLFFTFFRSRQMTDPPAASPRPVMTSTATTPATATTTTNPNANTATSTVGGTAAGALMQALSNIPGTLSVPSYAFWWNMFKSRIAPVLYPKECAEAGHSIKDVAGFLNGPPPSLHVLVHGALMDILCSPPKFELADQTPTDALLIPNLLKYSFVSLSLSEADLMMEAMRVYRGWMLGGPSAPVRRLSQVTEQLDRYVQMFTDHISALFRVPASPSSQSDALCLLCRTAIDTMRSLITACGGQPQADGSGMSQRTLAHLLGTLMRITDDLLTRPADDPIRKHFEELIPRLLLYFWTRLRPTDDWIDSVSQLTNKRETVTLWQSLHLLTRKLFTIPSVHSTWRDNVLKFVELLIYHLYKLPKAAPDNTVVFSTAPGGGGGLSPVGSTVSMIPAMPSSPAPTSATAATPASPVGTMAASGVPCSPPESETPPSLKASHRKTMVGASAMKMLKAFDLVKGDDSFSPSSPTSTPASPIPPNSPPGSPLQSIDRGSAGGGGTLGGLLLWGAQAVDPGQLGALDGLGVAEYHSFGLSLDDCLYLWSKYLNLYGNPNEGLSGDVFHFAMRTLAEVADEFLRVSKIKVKVPKGTPPMPFVHSPEGNTLLATLGDWLFEAADRTDDAHVDGCCVAAAALCRIFGQKCREPFKRDYLTQFYRMAYMCLQHPKARVSVFLNSSKLFCLDHPGSKMLIPHYCAACQVVLNTAGSSTELRTAVIEVLVSLLSIPYHFANVPIQDLRFEISKGAGAVAAGAGSGPAPSFSTFKKLRSSLYDLLIFALRAESAAENQIACLWGLYVVIFEEVQGVPDPSIVRECLRCVLSFLAHPTDKVAKCCHEVLSSMSSFLSKMEAAVKDATATIVQELSNAIIVMIHEARPETKKTMRVPIIVSMFFSLSELVSVSSHCVLENPTLSVPLFDAVSLALTGKCSAVKMDPKNKFAPEKDVREAAEIVLQILWNTVNAFPLPHGPARVSSDITEPFDDAPPSTTPTPTSSQSSPPQSGDQQTVTDGDAAADTTTSSLAPLSPVVKQSVHNNCQFFVFGDSTVATFSEMQHHDGSVSVRSIFRNMAGKFCWDASFLHYPSDSKYHHHVQQLKKTKAAAPDQGSGMTQEAEGEGTETNTAAVSVGGDVMTSSEGEALTTEVVTDQELSGDEQEQEQEQDSEFLGGAMRSSGDLTFAFDAQHTITERPLGHKDSIFGSTTDMDSGFVTQSPLFAHRPAAATGANEEQQPASVVSPAATAPTSTSTSQSQVDPGQEGGDKATVLAAAAVALGSLAAKDGMPRYRQGLNCNETEQLDLAVTFVQDKDPIAMEFAQRTHSALPPVSQFASTALVAKQRELESKVVPLFFESAPPMPVARLPKLTTAHALRQSATALRRNTINYTSPKLMLQQKEGDTQTSAVDSQQSDADDLFASEEERVAWMHKVVHPMRAFMQVLGLLSGDNRRDFLRLQAGTRLYRSLKQLDTTYAERETVKIGVVYVNRGQETQREILKNELGSAVYEEFVNSLGWQVELATHKGFLGGLDTQLTTGRTAPYYATATTEMMFHVVTRMPTTPGDEQQIIKKRHVGNDFVHIVWSEHDRDYRPHTISSDFNYAHIIVYPMLHNLFRVQIFAKQNVGQFGPLQDGMIVHRASLAHLARLTAANANRLIRHQQEGFKRPFPTRQQMLHDMIEKNRVRVSNEDFFRPFFAENVQLVEKVGQALPSNPYEKAAK